MRTVGRGEECGDGRDRGRRHGGLTSAFSGGNVLEGTASGLMNGLIDGFMWGGITAGVSNVIKPDSFCFIAGTKVLTDSGQKNIEDIEVGDQVLAYDEETGVTAYKPVLHLFRNTTKEWCTVSIRGAEGELYEITSTPGHKYFIPGNRVRKDSRALEHASYASLSEKWVSACDLKCGDKVLLSDGTLCEVEGVTLKQLETPETTYNLEVADFHTYYVSDACVLVHNLNCGNFRRLNDKKFMKDNHMTSEKFHIFKKKLIREANIPKKFGNNPDIYVNVKNNMQVGFKSTMPYGPKEIFETNLNLSEFVVRW